MERLLKLPPYGYRPKYRAHKKLFMKQARITWLPIIKKLPNNKTYYATVDFPNQNTWSVVIEFDEIPFDRKKLSYGYIRFLVDEAPINLLNIYREFFIKEGPFEVAKIEILN